MELARPALATVTLELIKTSPQATSAANVRGHVPFVPMVVLGEQNAALATMQHATSDHTRLSHCTNPPNVTITQRFSYTREARGRQEGETLGRREGDALGRARAIVDVLTRRGLTLLELQSARILSCRDKAKLARWWELAWTAVSVDELWDESDA